MEGLALLIAVVVVSAIAGALISKGCCGSGKATESCGRAHADSEKEKAIDDLISKSE